MSVVAAFLIVCIVLTLGKFRRKILFHRAQHMWNRNERECNHVRHDLVEGNTDIGTELTAFEPPAMITFKDPMLIKPQLNGTNVAILAQGHPKMRLPSPS